MDIEALQYNYDNNISGIYPNFLIVLKIILTILITMIFADMQ